MTMVHIEPLNLYSTRMAHIQFFMYLLKRLHTVVITFSETYDSMDLNIAD